MGNRVYVGNLSYQTDQEELKRAFATSGTVTDAKIMTDRESGQSRGFAFVSFASDDQAAQAIQDWNGQELSGRKLVVNEAQDRPQRTGGAPGGSRHFGGGGGGNGGYGGGNGGRGGQGGGGRGGNGGGRDRGSRRSYDD
jgi:RNA recognition motif-containing protein